MRNVICAKCGCTFGMPDELHKAAMRSSSINFFCPYGHTLLFPVKQKENNITNEDGKEEKVEINEENNIIDISDYRK